MQKAAALNIFEWNKMQTYRASSWIEKPEIVSIDKVRHVIQLLLIDMCFSYLKSLGSEIIDWKFLNHGVL